jgi:hypothetical protein
METVKKNLIAFICAAVALLAIIAYFWPIGSMYSSFQEDLDKNKSTYTDINSVSGTQFVTPRFSPDDKLPPASEWVANDATIKGEKQQVENLKQNANAALVAAVTLNRKGHDLLEPNALPQILGTTGGAIFRSKYNAVLDRGGKPERDPAHRGTPWPQNLPDEVLNSTTPPTAEEVQTALAKKWKDDYEWRINTANGQEINRKEIEEQFAKDTENFARDFYASKAKNFKLYMDPEALVRVPGLQPDKTPSVVDIWFGQMALWIEQDVCQAIHDVNQNAQGVAEAPVKNLMEVSLPPGLGMYVTSQEIGGAGTPGLAPIDPSQTYYSKSPTGRVCNTLYDVVHFRVVAVVDAQQVRPFLEQLRHDRFVTVLNVQSQTVDTRAAQDQGYIYGKAPCVQLTLECEELFLRDWTAPTRSPQIPGLPAPGSGPMPKEVQERLGIPAVTPAAPGTPGTPGTPAVPKPVALGQ